MEHSSYEEPKLDQDSFQELCEDEEPSVDGACICDTDMKYCQMLMHTDYLPAVHIGCKYAKRFFATFDVDATQDNPLFQDYDGKWQQCRTLKLKDKDTMVSLQQIQKECRDAIKTIGAPIKYKNSAMAPWFNKLRSTVIRKLYNNR